MSSEIRYYKVSFVVQGSDHPGAIINVDEEPQVGGEVSFDGAVFEILEVMDLMPPVGEFAFLHATCRYVRDVE